jgi:hypothetical protein
MKISMKLAKVAQVGLLSALALGAVALDARSARASDAKVYPGALCVPNGAWNSATIGRGSGAVTATYLTHLWCPIIGDNESSSTSAGIKSSKILILEGSGTSQGDPANTVCTLYSYGQLGQLPYDSSGQLTTSTGQNTLTPTLTKTTNPTAPAYPRYALACSLTGQSTLSEYEIEEK